MTNQYTYTQIASNFFLWQEFADPNHIMSREEFEATPIDTLVKMIENMFGPENNSWEIAIYENDIYITNAVYYSDKQWVNSKLAYGEKNDEIYKKIASSLESGSKEGRIEAVSNIYTWHTI